MLDLGYGNVINEGDIVFIEPYGREENSALMFALLARAEAVYISETGIKSIVYIKSAERELIYYSPLTAVTLCERANERIKF